MNGMKRPVKIILSTITLLLGIAAVAIPLLYVWAVRPWKQFADPEWWSAASQDEQRELCHRLLSRRLEQHSVFFRLREIGDKNSVPLLIGYLDGAFPPLEDGGTCSTTHCLDALRSLTGHDAGKGFDEWNEWWKTTGAGLPADTFHSRAANKALQETSDSAPSAESEAHEG